MRHIFPRQLLALAAFFVFVATSRADDPEPDVLPLWENAEQILPVPQSIDEEPLEQPPTLQSLSLLAPATPSQEIAALADALGNDPVRIFNHVRNQIDYEHYYGLRKGAALTMMEGSGNDADQCALLAALLNAAGYTGVKFRTAKQALYYADNGGKNLMDWMGLASEPYPGRTYAQVFPTSPLPPEFSGASELVKKRFAWASSFLGSRGSPTVFYDPANVLIVYIDRVWLELTVPGHLNAYRLDPSFKRYEKIAGADLLTPDIYSRASLLSAAGGTTGTGYAQSLNTTNIATQLTSLTGSVLAKIQANYPNATLAEITKGRRIIKEDITSLSEGFPFGMTFYGTDGDWAVLKSTVRFVTGSLDYTIPTSDLDGRRIALSFDGNNIRLWLDDTQVATTTTTNTATTFSLQITVTHPGGRIAQMSESKTYKKNAAFSYAIIYGFNASGKQLQKRYEVLNNYIDSGLADDSRQVRAELLNIMGLTWLYQTELASRLAAASGDVLNTNHHRFGRMAQEEGFYVDVGLQRSGVLQSDGDKSARYDNVFHLGSLFASALEHGIIEQMQPGASAVSTVNIIRKANTGAQRLYLADSTNWSGTVRGQLQNYTSALLAELDTQIAAGAKLFLPRNANVSQGNWTGTGYVIRRPDQAGMIISGGYSGGYSTAPSYVSSPSISSSSFYSPTYTYSSPTIPTIPIPPPSAFAPSFYGSDPVDMATGAFSYANTDLETGVAPAPEGLDFSRHYTSLSARRDGQNLGFGWTHALHLRAVVRTANEESLGLGTPQQAAAFITSFLVTADLYRQDASAKEWGVAALAAGWYLDQMKDNAVSITIGNQSFQFIKQPNGAFTPPAGSTMSLALVSGKYELRQRLGNVIKFDAAGKGLSITDPDAQTLSFVYNADDTLNYVQDAYGRRLTLAYTTTSPKRITRVTDSTDSRYVEFRYDASGNLDRFTDPEGKYSYYDYALPGAPAGTSDAHRIYRLRNHDDQTITTNAYDLLGRVSEQYLHGDTSKTYKLRYTGYANTEENPAHGVTTYFYDERGRSTGSRDPSAKENRWTYNGQDQIATSTTPSGETTTYHYDGNNNLTQIDHPRGGGSTLHAYDSLGRLDLTTDPEGKTTDYVYFPTGADSAKNRPYQIIDPVGTTTFQYYASGTGAVGKLWKSTDAQSLVTEYAYDANGQPDWIKAPGGFKTDYQYTARGDLDYEDDPNLIRTDYTYNKRRQVTQVVSNLGGPDAATEDFSYDNAGLLQTTTAPPHNGGLRAQTRQTYSPTEQLRYTYLANDTPSTDDDLVAETRYDSRDWPEKSFDAAARETSVEYLPNGKPWKTTVPLARQGVSAYDDDGRATAQTTPGSPTARTVGFGYSTTSTAAGDRTQGYPKTTFTDSDSIPSTSEQDRLGRVRYVTNKLGQTFEFRYDGLGRQTRVITPLDALNSRSHQTAYNHRGAPTLITEPSGQTATFAYAPTTGRLSSVTYADGATTQTVNYSLYDSNGNLKTVTEGAQTLQRTYDNLDRVKTYTDSNGQQLQYRYYPSGALQKLIYPGGNDTTTGHVEYTYYQTGRLKEVIDRLNAPAVTRTTTYYWNNDGRLARIVRPNATERRITYDAAGRPELVEEFATPAVGPPRLISAYKNGYFPSDEVQWTYALPKSHPALTVPGAVGSMTYRADNSLETFEGLSVVHDPDGNMTSGPLPSGTFGTYGYDIRNRLASAGGVTYGYDPDGNRISATDAASGTTTYLVEPNLGISKVLARTKAGQTTRYVWGAGLLYEVDAAGDAVYYHYDQVGSTTALTNSAAEVIERIEYAPFGWVTYRSNKTGTVHDTPFLYTGFFGNQTDANGLIEMRARYYNPLTRRFLNSDPAREGGNWYAYAAGNPLAFIDPSGLGIEGALDATQNVLSYLGLVPVVGEVFDLVNAGISVYRGNYGEAVLYAASAIPVLGSAIGGATIGVKYGRNVIRAFEGPLASLGRAQLSRGGANTLGRNIQRMFATPVRYAPVSSTSAGRALSSLGNFQQHHVFIPQKAFRSTSASRIFPNNNNAQRGLARIGNAGANLVPITANLNNYLGKSPYATGAFAGYLAGEPFRLGYDTWRISTQD
jgi:RHS repeat-associated protein